MSTRSDYAAAAASLGLLLATVAVSGCQSTADKSQEIADSLGPVAVEKGLKIDQESKDVSVVDTTVLTDENGTAVVVTVKNNTDQTLANVPILIDVKDAKEKSVYKNDIPGIEPALASIPMIRPGEQMDWVNNQVLPVGEPDSVKVVIGADASTFEGQVPDIEVQEPELENDQVSGINAAGTAVNHTEERHKRLLIYGVARSGDEIVAAGRAAVEKMGPGRERGYHIYFIGDPEGADLAVTSFPTLETSNGKES